MIRCVAKVEISRGQIKTSPTPQARGDGDFEWFELLKHKLIFFPEVLFKTILEEIIQLCFIFDVGLSQVKRICFWKDLRS